MECVLIATDGWNTFGVSVDERLVATSARSQELATGVSQGIAQRDGRARRGVSDAHVGGRSDDAGAVRAPGHALNPAAELYERAGRAGPVMSR